MEITKDQVVEISKAAPGLKNVVVGLGWDKNPAAGAAFDLDASAYVLNEGRLANNGNAVFFQNKTSSDGAVVHSGDNLTGDGDGDDETIKIDLSKVSGNQVDIVLCLYQAGQRGQSLSQIPNAYIRLLDADQGNKELLRFKVTGAEISGPSLLFASLLKIGGEWQFKALSQPLTGEITQVLGSYGYQVAA